MSEKKSDLKRQGVKAVVDNPISEIAFTGLSKRFPISSLSLDAGVEEGLLSFVFYSAKRGVKNAFRFSKAEWITLAVIVIIWAGTGILKSLNMDIPIVKVLAFITSSYNGLDTGIISIAGGIAAKSFVVAAASGTLIPLIASLFSQKRQKEYAGFSRFIKSFKKINLKSRANLSIFFLGVGGALIFYSFLSVDGSFQNNFVSILAALSIIKGFGSKTGFLSGLISRVLRRSLLPDNGVKIVMTGMAAGYILSIPISLMLSDIGGIGYIIGAVSVAAGVIQLRSKNSDRKEEQNI